MTKKHASEIEETWKDTLNANNTDQRVKNQALAQYAREEAAWRRAQMARRQQDALAMALRGFSELLTSTTHSNSRRDQSRLSSNHSTNTQPLQEGNEFSIVYDTFFRNYRSIASFNDSINNSDYIIIESGLGLNESWVKANRLNGRIDPESVILRPDSKESQRTTENLQHLEKAIVR